VSAEVFGEEDPADEGWLEGIGDDIKFAMAKASYNFRNAIKEWMKDNNKTATGPAYEVYVTDPLDKDGKAIDPYKVQTDIIFPIR